MNKITSLLVLLVCVVAFSACSTPNKNLESFSENERQIVCDDVREKHVKLSQELLEAERKLLKSKVNESAHEKAETTCWTCSTGSYLNEQRVKKKRSDLKDLEKTFYFCFTNSKVK